MALGTLSSSYNSAPAANTAAVVTLSADVIGRRIRQISWSYSGDPTGGSLKIEDGSGNVVFGPHAITSGGPGYIPFVHGEQGSSGTALVVTLAAGGSGITGALTVSVQP